MFRAYLAYLLGDHDDSHDHGDRRPAERGAEPRDPRTRRRRHIQRLGGAIGTALFAIVLSRQAGAGGVRVRRAGALAGAFGTTFWVAAGLIALAVVPALLLPRPRRANEANANADSGAAADAAVGGEQAKAAGALGRVTGVLPGAHVHRRRPASKTVRTLWPAWRIWYPRGYRSGAERRSSTMNRAGEVMDAVGIDVGVDGQSARHGHRVGRRAGRGAGRPGLPRVRAVRGGRRRRCGAGRPASRVAGRAA